MQLKNIKKVNIDLKDEKLKPLESRFNDLQIEIHKSLEGIITKQVINGMLHEDISLTCGTEYKLAHKLGRLPKGWLVADKDTDVNIYATAIDDKYITLMAKPNVIITNWVEYTPTLVNWVKTGSIKWFWRRIGDSLEVRGKYTVDSVSGSMRFKIPSSLSIDYTKVDNGYSLCGYAVAIDSNIACSFGGKIRTYNGTSDTLQLIGISGIYEDMDATHPMTWAVNDDIAVQVIDLPIIGWGNPTTVKSKIWIF